MFIIGNSFASSLHTLIIPMIAYIIINEYRAAFRIAFKIGKLNKKTEHIIDTDKENNTIRTKRFIPWIA